MTSITLIGTWRKIRDDGVETIIKSIEKNGILEEHFWLVMKLEKPEELFQYVAIDCNHRLVAFKKLQIKQARALVFDPLPEDLYMFIAGKVMLLFFLYD